jgi:hypothetical protein
MKAKKTKKKITLFLTTLTRKNEQQLLLFPESIHKWIVNGGDEGDFPDDVVKFWMKRDRIRYHKTEYLMDMAQDYGTAYQNNTPDLRASEVAPLALFTFDNPDTYKEWYAQNQNKFTIEEGFRGKLL